MGNSKEEKYKKQLESLGIYHPAMDPLIHDLAVLERECSRTRQAWKRTAPANQSPSPLDPYYTMIRQQQRDILALRNALGLTPMALRRIRGMGVESNKPVEVPKAPTVLDFVRQRKAE
jgi:hypothetical protein